MNFKDSRKPVIIVLSLCAVVTSLGWIVKQTESPRATMHSANDPTNRSRPTVSAMGGAVKQISEQLGLTPAQTSEMLKLADDAEPRMNAIQSDKTLSSDRKQALLGEHMKELATSVSKILTPEQNEGFQKMMVRMHGGHHHPGG